MRRLPLLFAVPLASAAFGSGCSNGQPGGPDAPVEETAPADVRHFDVVNTDGGLDGSDATLDGPPDVGPIDTGPQPVDASVPEVSIPDGGACAPVPGSMAVLSAESTVRTRDVYATGDAESFGFAASLNRTGEEQIWWDNLTHLGAMANLGVVSDAPHMHQVRGGSFTRYAELFALAYSTDETGNADVWVNVMQSNAGFVGHSRVQISNDPVPSNNPQIVQSTQGFLVVWQSVESGRTRLLLSKLNGIVMSPTTPAEVSRTGADVRSFRLIGTVTPETYAVAYLDAQGGALDLRLQPLNADGTLMGASTSVVAGSDLANGIDAAADNGDALVVWTQPATAPTLHVRRIGVVAGGMGTGSGIDLGSTVPSGASGPGIDVDDAGGYVIGYRSSAGGTTYLAMARLHSDLTVRDSSLLAGAASGGRVAAVSTAGFSTYGFGWADDFASGTDVRVLVAQCP